MFIIFGLKSTVKQLLDLVFSTVKCIIKQLLDLFFVIYKIINAEGEADNSY